MGLSTSGVVIPATRGIVNGFSSGGTSSKFRLFLAEEKSVASGALTANTLATVLSISGVGEVPLLAAYTVDTTSRTIRMQVIVDGGIVFDATTNAITVANFGTVAAGTIGAADSSGNLHLSEGLPIRFNSSLVVKIASSLSETDKITLAYKARTE